MSEPMMDDPRTPFAKAYNEGHLPIVIAVPGLTLRDYFAAAALPGLIAADGAEEDINYAVTAYVIADAMLKAREKQA